MSFHDVSLLPGCCDGVRGMRHRVPTPRKGIVNLWWDVFAFPQLLCENLGIFPT